MPCLVLLVRPGADPHPSRPANIQAWTQKTKTHTAHGATERHRTDTRLWTSRFVFAAVTGGLAITFAACSSDSDGEGSPMDPSPPAASGAIEVTITTIGDEQDPNGYSLAVDGEPGQATELNQQLTLTDLTVGDHSIELTDVAANCRVTNVENPSSVAVPEGAAAQISYVIFCLPSDAGRIYYISGGNASIQSIPAIGGDPSFIGPTGVPAFSVSRGGSRIVYSIGTPDGQRLFVQDADGSNSTLVTEEIEPGSRPDVSPDGTRIVFTEEGGDGSLFVINVDGSGLTNLTPGSPQPNSQDPAWSPDGDRIVFSAPSDELGCFLALADERAPLFVINSDGSGGAQPLTNPADGIYHLNPDWSPDGNRIAFSACGDVSDIFLVDPDGAGLLQLMPDISGSGPSWSPDGRWIAFSSDGIYVMRADGTDVVQLTFDGETAPQWR